MSIVRNKGVDNDKNSQAYFSPLKTPLPISSAFLAQATA